MAEYDQLSKEKYKIIIYHGHIHVLSLYEEHEDNDNIAEIENDDF